MCDEGNKCLGYAFNCDSKRQRCALCGQTVCGYHAAANNAGAVGGHSGCKDSCKTNNPQKCKGYMGLCRGCRQPYCSLHISQCATCAGGGSHGLCAEAGCNESVVQPCILCGKHVCLFHAASHDGRAEGGHKCSDVCHTNSPTDCQGYMQRCKGCMRNFCRYHSQQAGEGRTAGGHLCRIYCQTSQMFRDNCAGEIAACKMCSFLYCQYHAKPNTSILQFVGGHVCKPTAGSDIVPGSFSNDVVGHQVESVFEGRVFRGGMRNVCVVSFPGKFVDIWNLLVKSCKERTLSSACVFLPKEDPMHRFGKHAGNPETPGRCYCHTLYGSRKEWGCEWFKDWRSNVEDAVRLELTLVVVYFPNKVGQGIVGWDDLARAGEGLWARPGGLGGSQKGEVAFLAKNGWRFEGIDVDDLCAWFGIMREGAL